MKRKLFWFGLWFLGLFSIAHAQTQPEWPLYCYKKGYAFIDQAVHFEQTQKPAPQQLFWIKNNSSTVIWINHEADEISASAGWATELMPKKWTALMLDRNSFSLKCVEIKPGAEQVIDCSEVLFICRQHSIDYPTKSKGSYWAAENSTLDEVEDALHRRGITMKKRA